MSLDISKFLTEGNNPTQVLLEQTRGLRRKWNQSGLLEGLKDYDSSGMAVMLENQANQLIMETTKTTVTAGGEQWAGVALPLVRKVFGQIASKNFVSVQPMNLPAGLVFYMDFQYGTTKAPRTVADSMYGDTTSSAAPQGGLYGDGKFGYTINDASTTAVTTGSTYPVVITAATAVDINFDSSYNLASLSTFAVPVANMTNPDLNGVRGFVPVGLVGILPSFTRIAGTTVVFVANTDANPSIVVKYQKQPTDSSRGDFEDRTGADIGIPEVDLQLRSETVVAKTRKLKAVWTPELAQDLNAYHSIDAEAELTAMLSEYISIEIDLEILDMLIVNAKTVDYWSTTIGEKWNGTTFVNDTNLAAQAWTNMTWYQTLGQKIQRVSNKIHQLTMRGGANFAVVSPDIATVLESIPGYAAATDGNKLEFSAGVSAVGSLQSRWTIYKNPYMVNNLILVGFKGTNFLETGAVYAPYIPLILTPLVYDPVNFTPRRGVMTRYAKKMVRPEFYGVIKVKGMNLI